MINNSIEYILCAAYKLPDDFMYPNIEKINHNLNSHEAALNGEPFKDVRDTYTGPHREVFNMATGWRHCDILWKYGKEVCKSQNSGFMTSKGRFVDREEGMKIAFIAGQVSFNKAVRNVINEDDKKFWGKIKEDAHTYRETDWSIAQRKVIAENVTEWFTLYSEHLY